MAFFLCRRCTYYLSLDLKLFQQLSRVLLSRDDGNRVRSIISVPTRIVFVISIIFGGMFLSPRPYLTTRTCTPSADGVVFSAKMIDYFWIIVFRSEFVFAKLTRCVQIYRIRVVGVDFKMFLSVSALQKKELAFANNLSRGFCVILCLFQFSRFAAIKPYDFWFYPQYSHSTRRM